MTTDHQDKVFAVYVIAGRTLVESFLDEGEGEFVQGGRWTRASELLEASRSQGEQLPLLIADAGTTAGVEWRAQLEYLEPAPGKRTRIRFSGLRPLRNVLPLSELVKLSDGKPLRVDYRHGNVVCRVSPSTLKPVPFRAKVRARAEELAPGSADAAAEIASDPKCRHVPETMRRALINARIGQGGYRRRLLNLWGGRCAVTGSAVDAALVASHAKPWAESRNDERLNEFNGLPLAATLDRLFDRGLIAFNDNGTMLLSPKLSQTEARLLGVETSAALRFVQPGHVPFLQAHRMAFGFKA